MITGTGRDWVSAKVICLPSCSAARSASREPVRFSSMRKPCDRKWPFVVPDSARIASQACKSRASDGPAVGEPPRTTPFLCRR